jgi:hypothetical protein
MSQYASLDRPFVSAIETNILQLGHFVMINKSSPFHDGFGSAFKKSSTDLKSANSTKTEPCDMFKLLALIILKKSPKNLERFCALYAPHAHSVSFAVLVEVLFQF